MLTQCSYMFLFAKSLPEFWLEGDGTLILVRSDLDDSRRESRLWLAALQNGTSNERLLC